MDVIWSPVPSNVLDASVIEEEDRANSTMKCLTAVVLFVAISGALAITARDVKKKSLEVLQTIEHELIVLLEDENSSEEDIEAFRFEEAKVRSVLKSLRNKFVSTRTLHLLDAKLDRISTTTQELILSLIPLTLKEQLQKRAVELDPLLTAEADKIRSSRPEIAHWFELQRQELGHISAELEEAEISWVVEDLERRLKSLEDRVDDELKRQAGH